MDFKLFPSSIDKNLVKTEWDNYPSLVYFNVDSGFLNIQDGDRIPIDKRFVIKGYAISGRGN